MLKNTISVFILLALPTVATLETYAQSVKNSKPAVNLIFDTDIGPDYDDVGAMAVMHALADSGQVNILATIACNRLAWSGEKP
ncbi:MAG: hypothetical protein MUD08_10610 [Cytophagales bacterium]|nr:hypothetical protein [Cytophagales bacterium]